MKYLISYFNKQTKKPSLSRSSISQVCTFSTAFLTSEINSWKDICISKTEIGVSSRVQIFNPPRSRCYWYPHLSCSQRAQQTDRNI